VHFWHVSYVYAYVHARFSFLIVRYLLTADPVRGGEHRTEEWKRVVGGSDDVALLFVFADA
jgi:hypothetical protein